MSLETHVFEQVADAVRSLTPARLGDLRLRSHRRGVKAWFGPVQPGRLHFEAQLLARRHIDGIDGAAIEIGFHAEHRDVKHNQGAIDALVAREPHWRPVLGPEAEVGEFYGADAWRRVSESWIEPDLDDPELAFEMAARLVDYLVALQPFVGEIS